MGGGQADYSLFEGGTRGQTRSKPAPGMAFSLSRLLFAGTGVVSED